MDESQKQAKCNNANTKECMSCVSFIWIPAAAAAAKSLQSCPTLCDPIEGSPPGPPVPGILQTRILEWVAISFSKAWKWKVKVKSLSRVRLLATPWTAAHQAPPSMGFSRQEYRSGLPLPSLIYHKHTCKMKCILKTPGHHYHEDLSLSIGPALTALNICSVPNTEILHVSLCPVSSK